MKKIITLLLSLAFVLSFVACRQNGTADNGNNNDETPDNIGDDNTDDDTTGDDTTDDDTTGDDNTGDDTTGDDNTDDDTTGDDTTDDDTTGDDNTGDDTTGDDTTGDDTTGDDTTDDDTTDDGTTGDDTTGDDTTDDDTTDDDTTDDDTTGDDTTSDDNTSDDNTSDDNTSDDNNNNNDDNSSDNTPSPEPSYEDPPANKIILHGNKGWIVKRGTGWICTDDNRLMYWVSSQNNTTYDWPAINENPLTEGTITAVVSARGNVGIFFGGSGIEKSTDATSNLTGTPSVYYSVVTLLVDARTGAASLEFYYDNDDTIAYNGTHKITVPLNDTPANAQKYGFDGISDVEIKVVFTKAGKITAYLNGVKAIETLDKEFPTFGDQHGITVRSAYYPKDKVAGYVKNYDTAVIENIKNGVNMELHGPVTLLASGNSNAEIGNVSSTHYPSIIELKYQKNEEDNGKLIAHFRLSASKLSTNACFMESMDGGKTWQFLSMPTEQKSTADKLVPGQMAHLYELPAQLGSFPAGTLVYSSGSINYSVRSEIWIWYSTDCGKTWTQTSKVATGGVVNAVGEWPKQSGVWEPFTWYEDGYLYCFYSDDSDPKHSQKIVYKRSQDGINWSSIVDVCTFSDPDARPGMFVMTKMGNGEFFMVYEYIGAPLGSKVYYKKTSDITNWNPSSAGNVLRSGLLYYGGSAPSCLWIPAGGDQGMLIATTMWDTDGTHKIFVSFDYGESWTTMKNPLPYTTGTDTTESGGSRIGYSPSFALGADGRTVYYLNTTDVPETGKRRIQFSRFVILDD